MKKGQLRFKRTIISGFFIRFHMSLILGGTLLSGTLASRALLGLGLNMILARLILALFLSYGAFFVLIRLWLAYVRSSKRASWSSSSSSSHPILNRINVPQMDPVSFNIVSPAPSPTPSFGGGGGKSGGGGASGSWVPSITSDVSESVATNIDLDAQAAPAVAALLAFALLIIAVFGAGIFLIYDAPAILSEAALQMALSTSLLKATRRMNDPDWVGSVFMNTWKPFAAVLLVGVIVGQYAYDKCPRAIRVIELTRACR